MPLSHEVSRAHVELMEGRSRLPWIGEVVCGRASVLPWLVRDGAGREVEPVSIYLRDRMLGDISPLTCRSYAHDLLRWFRVLWAVDVGWEQATEAEVAALVGWLRSASNPQRARCREGGYPAGSVNPKTGKPVPAAGYAPATIAHNMSVLHEFYAFHLHFGRGPVVNPVPGNRPGGRRWRMSRRWSSPGRTGRAGCGPRWRPGNRGRFPIRSGTSCSHRWAAPGTGPCWPATSVPGRGPLSCWGCRLA